MRVISSTAISSCIFRPDPPGFHTSCHFHHVPSCNYPAEIAGRIMAETEGHGRIPVDLRGGNRRNFATDTRRKKQGESAVKEIPI